MIDDPLVRKYLFQAPYGCRFKAKIKGGYVNQLRAPKGWRWGRDEPRHVSIYYRYAKVMKVMKS